MAAGRFVVPPYFPARDRDFNLLAGALLYVYENETTTKTNIYTDVAMTVLSSNPVVANSSGQFPAIYAEAGTEASPVLYSVSVTTSTGASPGNPFNFDNYRPSVDWETAASALSEAAAEVAVAASVSAAADAVQTAADLAAIELIIADAPDAPSVLNKLNLNGDNVGSNAATLRDNIGAVSVSALALSTGAGLVGSIQAGTGAVEETVQTQLRRIRFATSYGFSTSGTAAANATALQAGIDAVASLGGGTLFVAPGSYTCNKVVPKSRVVIEGMGYGYDNAFTNYNTMIVQGTAGDPVFDFDATALTLRGANVKGIIIKGHASSSSALVKYRATAPYTISNCDLDLETYIGFRAYEAVVSGGNVVYLNNIRIRADGCTDDSFVTYGAYNDYYLIANANAKKALVCNDDGSTFFQMVADSVIDVPGAANEFISPKVETIHTAPGTPYEGAILARGVGNSFLHPIVRNVQPARAVASFRDLGESTWFHPLVDGSVFPAFSFDLTGTTGSTVVGGSISCTNKLEAHAGAAAISLMTLLGNTSSYYTQPNGTTVNGDAAATLTNTLSDTTQIWNSPLTTARAVTLSTTGAVDGAKFLITRTTAATGNFALNVGTGPLRALNGPGQWCEVTYNGSAWLVTAAGDLNLPEGVTNFGDEGATLTVGTTRSNIRVLPPLTADRAYSISTTAFPPGYTFRITRAASSTGAFNLSVNGLKNLATGTWCDVTFDADNGDWYLSGYGAL